MRRYEKQLPMIHKVRSLISLIEECCRSGDTATAMSLCRFTMRSLSSTRRIGKMRSSRKSKSS